MALTPLSIGPPGEVGAGKRPGEQPVAEHLRGLGAPQALARLGAHHALIGVAALERVGRRADARRVDA